MNEWLPIEEGMTCRYAQKSEECYVIGPDGKQRRVDDPAPSLCGWAMDAAPSQLVNVPRWLQRNALAGHLLKYPEDCIGCPCYEARKG